MTTFVLVPGAGGQAWYWHRVVERLEARGHEAVAVDLPATDEGARLEDYVRTVVDATPPPRRGQPVGTASWWWGSRWAGSSHHSWRTVAARTSSSSWPR